jgi:hypothetical protein
VTQKHHLFNNYLYPMDFSLFLLNWVLILYYINIGTAPTLILTYASVAANLFLFSGWALNRRRQTYYGAMLSIVLWLGQLMLLLAQGDFTLVGLAFMVSAVASFNLALGIRRQIDSKTT